MNRVADAKTESARFFAEIREGMQHVGSWGCVAKDPDHDLMDFLPCRGHEQVFLCWRLGEAEIRYRLGL